MAEIESGPDLLRSLGSLLSRDRDRVGPSVRGRRARERIERLAQQAPVPLPGLIEEILELARDGMVQTNHPRYFGFFQPRVSLASVVADAIAAAFNPQLASLPHSRAAAEIESAALDMIATRFGMSTEEHAVHFTSGGSEATLTALLAALARKIPGYIDRGVRAAPADPVIYASETAHDSIVKVARAAGLGGDAVRRIRATSNDALDVRALAEAVADDRSDSKLPLFVLATAGTTVAGAIDPLAEIGEVADREGLWMHVDAAFGGIAAFSPRTRRLLVGIERAISITFDAHKALPVSMAAGVLLCRDRPAVESVFDLPALPYLPAGARRSKDPFRASLPWSRRFIGLKVFMTLVELGESGLSKSVEDLFDRGRDLRELLYRRGFKVANDSPLPIVCFTHPRIEKGDAPAHSVARRIWNRGRVFLSDARLRSQAVLRACIANDRTDRADLDQLVSEVERSLDECAGAGATRETSGKPAPSRGDGHLHPPRVTEQ